uniref:Uncharacterized protein n=1 Tax=Rhizophora mucronata TaxID=61149 RepID=A0A2P2KGW3_RHIMU
MDVRLRAFFLLQNSKKLSKHQSIIPVGVHIVKLGILE